jgi:hypothetical protein
MGGQKDCPSLPNARTAQPSFARFHFGSPHELIRFHTKGTARMQPHDPRDETAITQVLLVSRIILGGLASGVIFAVVAFISVRQNQPPGEPFLANYAAGCAGLFLLLRLAVLGIITRRRNASPRDLRTLLRLYQTRLIVGLAILEGAALFNAVAYLIAGQWWSLAVVGVLLALMLTSFPTRMGIEQWLDDGTERRNGSN